MLTLLLMRHTKAELGSMSIADIDRELAPRGRRDAPRLGADLAASGPMPDLVLCSPAQRTRETWGLLQPALGDAVSLQIDPLIYDATAARLLSVIRRVPDSVQCLMLIGHNPGLEELATDLVRGGDPTAVSRLQAKFPTGGVAVLALNQTAWSQLTPRSATLVRFIAPRYLAD